MVSVVVVLGIAFIVGFAAGLAIAMPIIARLEAKVKKLDMASGYEGRE